jgi:methanogenic corrinoid protein MtbC1
VQWGLSENPESALERVSAFLERPRPEPAASHLQAFSSVIENFVVPRLLMSHMTPQPKQPKMNLTRGALDEGVVGEFITQTLADDPEKCVDFVRNLLVRGIPIQSVFLHLMAPAARELGERWERDKADFFEVTLGMARMHRVLREFDGIPPELCGRTGEGHNALLLPTPGEAHSFGLRLVQEFLLRESWNVTNRLVASCDELEALVASQYYDFAGLSLSGETLIEALASAIQTIKSKSRNRHIRIIVGGHIFTEQPNLVAHCGADAFASDAPSGVAIVNGWVSSARAPA